ncbi:MAG: WYL domain-containing protein [Ginsengibacter sp.]
MPVNKSAHLRYRIIDGCLTNPLRTYPSMGFIISKIEEQLDTTLSDSMFNKDIQHMKRIYGAPIKYDRNHGGYYYTEPGFSIKEFPLTHDEIEALDFSTALFQQLKGTKMFQQFENAINKVIEGYRISKIIRKSENQILQIEEPLKTGGNEWLEIILKSIVEKNCLKLTYQGFGRQEKEHEFSAYLLKEYRNRWYAVGFSNTAKKILVLALDRVNNIMVSKSKYVPGDNFVPAEFFNYSLGITQIHDANPEKVILSFTPGQAEYIISQPLHHSQQIIVKNNKEVRIELNVYITQELKMLILGYGENVTVLSPDILKNEIKDCIKKMQELYK